MVTTVMINRRCMSSFVVSIQYRASTAICNEHAHSQIRSWGAEGEGGGSSKIDPVQTRMCIEQRERDSGAKEVQPC